jgi:hypothetical protein
MTIRRATCSCGKLSAITQGEPTRVSVCHCWACQRRTGSVFSAQARFAKDDVRIEGDSQNYERTGDDGGRATFHFCGECGATVYYVIETMPDVIAVPLGAFASRDLPPPAYSVYEARRHEWVEIRGEIERYE